MIGGEPTLPVVNLLGYELQLTKFMVLQVVAGLLTLIIFRGLASHIAGGKPARGVWWNFLEMLALYIRDTWSAPRSADITGTTTTGMVTKAIFKKTRIMPMQ